MQHREAAASVALDRRRETYSIEPRTIVGIDPGKSGGIAAFRPDGEIETYALAKLTERDLWLTLAELEPATVWLELVHATPQMGRTSAFTFGECYGQLRMACIAAGLRLETVTPTQWQKPFRMRRIEGGIGKNDTAKKNRNKAKAQELFPQIKVTHAIADALLIAEYGRRSGL